MTLVIGSTTYGVPTVPGISFVEHPGLQLDPEDWRPRRKRSWIRGICIHTRMGMPVVEVPGAGPNKGWDQVLAKRFARDERKASAHIAIDADGSYACMADLAEVATYHAGHVNEISVGIEMYQEYPSGKVWSATMATCVHLCDIITRVLGIQRQYPLADKIQRRLALPAPGRSRSSRLAYVAGGGRGRDWCGLYGHRNTTRNRGVGDPGDQVWEHFKAAGYEAYDVDGGDDLDVWSERQEGLGIAADDCDGIPGPHTRSRIVHSGRNEHGVWVCRPGDQMSAPPATS